MCLSSASTSSTFSPERNVLSITFPSIMCLSLVRTNAPPFPGFTCWKSTIVYGLPSKTIRNPFLNSADRLRWRSEEHTSELQSQSNLVCRLLLEKKKKNLTTQGHTAAQQMNIC